MTGFRTTCCCIFAVVCTLVFFKPCSAAQEPLSPGVRFDTLVIEKKAKRLTAWGKGKQVREYRVALGANPVGPKRVEGDAKTPEGVYCVDGKNPHSRFYKNLGVSYPDAQARKNAAALGKSPGGDIKIHGLGRSSVIWAGNSGNTTGPSAASR